eukprot:762672-Hanusia_phi.AAC.1
MLASRQGAMDLVKKGMAARAVGVTNMNSHSSRSHCIFSLRVEQQHPVFSSPLPVSKLLISLGLLLRWALTGKQDGYLQRGELHFADLAGLERVDRTGAQVRRRGVKDGEEGSRGA